MRIVFGMLALFFFASTAHASQVLAVIDKSEQVVWVNVDGETLYTWPVSTGKKNTWTPSGTFGVQSMDATHRSSKYKNAPMPWSVFFDGDNAIHGTTYIERLGTPDSHGCTRLHPDNAKIFFNLVLQVGRENVIIVVQD